MKDLKVLFEDTLDLEEKTFFKSGDRIMYVLDDVARANPGKTVSDDSGYILKVTGTGYIVKSDLNGQELKVPNKSAVAYGGAGADGQTP